MFKQQQSASASLNSKYKSQITIAIDPVISVVHFYKIDNADKSTIKCTDKNFKARPFSDAFIEEFTEIVKNYAQGNPSVGDAGITLVLPDRAVAMDAISVPTMKKRKSTEAIDTAISGLYRNLDKLQMNKYLAFSNKQLTTYSISSMNTDLITAIKGACSLGGMFPQHITFRANTTVFGAEYINAKLRNASYLLLDIKKDSTCYSFVAKGRLTGFYDMPYGYSIIKDNTVVSEDMLIDHSISELVVLNAKEKAKAKQLTMMRDTEEPTDTEEGFEETEEDLEDPTNMNLGVQATNYKKLPKKQPRKLPKFMLRPTPETKEGFEYENFRIFIKWALDLIQSNEKLTMQGMPEIIYVNMPDKFEHLIETTNLEKDENKFEFALLDNKEKGVIRGNLELYGGFCSMSSGRYHTFS